MQVSVSGYETRVKIFMILVVLFLATANFVTVRSLVVTEARLGEEARARVLAASATMAGQAAAEDALPHLLEGKAGAAARAAADLYRYGRVHGAAVVEILDPDGRVIASSQTWRLGMVEPLGATVRRSDRELASGHAVLGDPAGDLTVAIVRLKGSEGGGRHYLRAGFVLEAVGEVSRQIRLLAWVQGVGGSVVLVMVLLFTRWVLRPYRELRATALGVEPPAEAARSASDDPGFLIASFRGVIDKMRSLEGELERMRAGASWPGGQEALLASLSSGVLILGESGEVAALNPAGEAILGLEASALLGRPVAAALDPSPDLVGILEEAVLHGRGRARQVVVHRRPGGRSVHLGVTVSGPPEGGGGALCLFSDLTEIRTVQDRVALKENLARLGQLSAGIAHEFRNSLATILGYARLAGREAGSSGENAGAIIREVQAMERVVTEFLRYAAPTRMQRGECALGELIRSIAGEVSREGEPGIEIAVVGEWPESITADEALLRQAFHNLIRNAAESLRGSLSPGRVTVRGRLEAGSLSIEIADSGPGFAPEVLDKLFTPFVTTKERGTGLGMALAQKAVVSHDGSIEAENGPGGGGVVRVILPLV